MKTKPSVTTLIIFALGIGAGTGCTDPRAAKPTQTRLDRINSYVTRAREREDEGPRRIAASFRLIEEQKQRDQAHLDRDLKYLRRWSERDVQRWNDRQPRYRADLEDMWDGNLELADETIPHMFY